MQVKRLAVLYISMALVAAAPLAPTSQFTLLQFDMLKKAIVRVDANQCPGKDRSATGFLWHRDTWIVTALHVVNGCQAISIYAESAKQAQKASVSRVLRKSDLALLQLGAPIRGTALLHAASATPAVTEDLEVLGYPLAIPKMDNTEVQLRFGGRLLRDIVPQAVTNELRTLGSPDPNIKITDIQGNLLPGHSGAPILDRGGRIVAIADGGLESGAVGVSWGLPVADLALLASSPDPITGPVPPSSVHLFAAETDAVNGPDVSCGGASFKRIRRLALVRILHATDDPVGLQQIITATGPIVSAFNYDVYQNPPTGATFVIPARERVASTDGMCTAESPTGNVVIRVRLISAPVDLTGQKSSVQYENSVLGTPGWRIDPAWSYLAPVWRFDGLVVRRKSWVHYSFYRRILDSTLFETLADRKGVFLGVSALNKKWNPPFIQACRSYPQAPPFCSEALRNFREWAQAVIAVHLATFPVG